MKRIKAGISRMFQIDYLRIVFPETAVRAALLILEKVYLNSKSYYIENV
jgi:hypothetical protein